MPTPADNNVAHGDINLLRYHVAKTQANPHDQTLVIPPKDVAFATSLIQQYDAKGANVASLSGKQWYWVYKLLQKGVEPKAGPKKRTQLNLPAIQALFKQAKSSGLKYPNIVLALVDGTPIQLSMATEASKTPGAIWIRVGMVNNSGWMYAGQVTLSGELKLKTPSSEAEDDLLGAIEVLMEQFAADPAGVAAEYGRLTGNCCFCQSKLTDEKSTAVGYGPVCAKRWKQPWGVVKHEFKAEAV